MLETAWESRWLPDILSKKPYLENRIPKIKKYLKMREDPEEGNFNGETQSWKERHPRPSSADDGKKKTSNKRTKTQRDQSYNAI